MATPKNDPHVYVQLAEKGLSNVAIAKSLGVDESSVRRGLAKADYKRYLLPVNHLPERFEFLLDEPFVLKTEQIGHPIMVTADWHIPVYDPYLVNHMILTARDIGSKTLIIAGDFFNHDALSRFDPKQDEASLEREWDEGRAVIRVLMETFDDIYYTYGNHDARLVKQLGFKIAFANLTNYLFGGLEGVEEKIHVSNLDHLWVSSPGTKYYVCHPKSYSRKPLTTAIDLAAKVGSSVLTAHAHHCAVGYAKNGKDLVSDVGGLFDTTRTKYLQDTTTYPYWSQGFAWIEPTGRYNLESPGFSFREMYA